MPERTSTDRAGRRLVQAVACGSLAAGVVHLGVCPEHFREATLFGVFFAIAATAQMLWAASIIRRPRRATLWVGAAGQVLTVAVWAMSRTTGLPVGPERWSPEAATPLDIFTSVIEVLVAIGALTLATGAEGWCRAGVKRAWSAVRACLPAGGVLPADVWAQRHRWIMAVLWAHIPPLLLYAIVRREPAAAIGVELGVVGILAIAASITRRHRRVSTILTALGLLTCSAVLVRVSGGMIEMHFHYFVMVGVITLYQDWWPFLVAIAYVVVQHGLAGIVDPTAVYNHREAIDHPWEWASIHGLFILGMSSAGIASWRLNESFLSGVMDREDKLNEAQAVAHLGSWEHKAGDEQATCSREFYRLMGLDAATTPPSMEAFLARIHPDDREAVTASLAATRDGGVPFAVDFRVVLDDGEIRWVHGRAKRSDDAQGQLASLSGTIQEITERKRLENELAHQAFHDSLTGLANKALFRDRVDHALARSARYRKLVAVLFLDLDRFKTVNDSLGHTAGDELLVSVARRFMSCLRASDTAARLGGDEFAVLIEDVDSESDVRKAGERILSVLQAPFVLGGQEVFVSASVGIAFHASGDTTDLVLRNADLAMYTAKRRGANRCEIYRREMHDKAVDRLELESDFRGGLARGEFIVQYQPIISLTTQDIVGSEALVRWRHPTRGMLAPDSFIPLAEETGLIRELGRQVLEQACAQTRQWQREFPTARGMSVSVNVSARQLQDDGLVAHVRSALAASGLDAAHLVLEITESAMMQDTEATIVKLHQLKSLGVRLAVDDFGTGYSSLSYLQRFPVDTVKIDRAFVAKIDTSPDDSSLADAIVSLAHTLRLSAVAEGVETEAQAGILAGLGCDLAQGFLFSRPVDREVVNELLGRSGGGIRADQTELVTTPAAGGR